MGHVSTLSDAQPIVVLHWHACIAGVRLLLSHFFVSLAFLFVHSVATCWLLIMVAMFGISLGSHKAHLVLYTPPNISSERVASLMQTIQSLEGIESVKLLNVDDLIGATGAMEDYDDEVAQAVNAITAGAFLVVLDKQQTTLVKNAIQKFDERIFVDLLPQPSNGGAWLLYVAISVVLLLVFLQAYLLCLLMPRKTKFRLHLVSAGYSLFFSLGSTFLLSIGFFAACVLLFGVSESWIAETYQWLVAQEPLWVLGVLITSAFFILAQLIVRCTGFFLFIGR